jgi:hypothetical protein
MERMEKNVLISMKQILFGQHMQGVPFQKLLSPFNNKWKNIEKKKEE